MSLFQVNFGRWKDGSWYFFGDSSGLVLDFGQELGVCESYRGGRAAKPPVSRICGHGTVMEQSGAHETDDSGLCNLAKDCPSATLERPRIWVCGDCRGFLSMNRQDVSKWDVEPLSKAVIIVFICFYIAFEKRCLRSRGQHRLHQGHIPWQAFHRDISAHNFLIATWREDSLQGFTEFWPNFSTTVSRSFVVFRQFTSSKHSKLTKVAEDECADALKFAVLDFGLAVRSGGWKHEWKAHDIDGWMAKASNTCSWSSRMILLLKLFCIRHDIIL